MKNIDRNVVFLRKVSCIACMLTVVTKNRSRKLKKGISHLIHKLEGMKRTNALQSNHNCEKIRSEYTFNRYYEKWHQVNAKNDKQNNLMRFTRTDILYIFECIPFQINDTKQQEFETNVIIIIIINIKRVNATNNNNNIIGLTRSILS